MEPAWLLLLLPMAAASGWWMASRDQKEVDNAKKQVPEAFFKGLNLLLNEQPDKALNVFLETDELDQDMVEMHIAMGNLFRRRGEIERATQIHQNLIARSDLDDGSRSMALYELAQDYFKAGLFDRAESLFQELRQVADFREQACRFLLQIYEQEREWHSAIVVGEELAQVSAQDFTEPLSQYCCELAEDALNESKAGKAEYYLESAFKYDIGCARAMILAGQVAASRGNHRDAISIWQGLQQNAPEALGEVVALISRSYAALEDADGFQRFLQQALEYNSDGRIIAALIEHTQMRQGNSAGQALLVDTIRRYPSLDGLYQLLKGKSGAEIFARQRMDLAWFVKLLSHSALTEREYRCGQCGFNTNTLHWQCPGCKAWGTVRKKSIARETVGHDIARTASS